MIIKRIKLFTKCYAEEYNELVDNNFNNWVDYVYQYVKNAHWSIANDINIDDYRDGLFVKNIETLSNNKLKATLKVTLKIKSSRLSKSLSEDYCWNLFLDKNNKVIKIIFGIMKKN